MYFIGYNMFNTVKIMLSISIPLLVKTGRRTKTMKTTGIVRKIDRLGRITIPIEIRNALQIHAKDELRL